MNIYHALNEMTQYIEDHLEEEIDEKILAKILGVNIITMKSLFNLMCNMTLSEYIRKRRLSEAGYDLVSHSYKVIDIAMRYGYQNAASFSRTFEKFHGIKPSVIKKANSSLRHFPRIIFEEKQILPKSIPYKIMQTQQMTLYGDFISTCENTISIDAHAFLKKLAIIMQMKAFQIMEWLFTKSASVMTITNIGYCGKKKCLD